MKNLLSIDLESWAHGTPVKVDKPPFGPPGFIDGGKLPSSIEFLLDVLKQTNNTATFFVVGEVYDWNPEMIEKIQKAGHEIAYHTMNHSVIHSVDILKNDLRAGKRFIQKFKPRGFRGPHIKMVPGGLPILKSHGFKYDSSSYNPCHVIDFNGFKEVPVSSIPIIKTEFKLPKQLNVRTLVREVPVGSGIFLGLLRNRYDIVIKMCHKRGDNFHMFVHPWQLFDARDAVPLSYVLTNPKWYPYSRNIAMPLDRVLRKYKFTSVESML